LAEVLKYGQLGPGHAADVRALDRYRQLKLLAKADRGLVNIGAEVELSRERGQ
jgi:hypothetical protein